MPAKFVDSRNRLYISCIDAVYIFEIPMRTHDERIGILTNKLVHILVCLFVHNESDIGILMIKCHIQRYFCVVYEHGN